MLEKRGQQKQKYRNVADIPPTDADRLLTKIDAGRARPPQKNLPRSGARS